MINVGKMFQSVLMETSTISVSAPAHVIAAWQNVLFKDALLIFQPNNYLAFIGYVCRVMAEYKHLAKVLLETAISSITLAERRPAQSHTHVLPRAWQQRGHVCKSPGRGLHTQPPLHPLTSIPEVS